MVVLASGIGKKLWEERGSAELRETLTNMGWSDRCAYANYTFEGFQVLRGVSHQWNRAWLAIPVTDLTNKETGMIFVGFGDEEAERNLVESIADSLAKGKFQRWDY